MYKATVSVRATTEAEEKIVQIPQQAWLALLELFPRMEIVFKLAISVKIGIECLGTVLNVTMVTIFALGSATADMHINVLFNKSIFF